MIYKKLGNTSVQISAIGQGTTGTGSSANANFERDNHRIQVLQRGIDLGLNLIDTAELYGGGHAEEIVGKAVKGRRNKVFITSKFNPDHNSYEGVLHAVEGSLKRVNTDYIDLYQAHWANAFIPVEETMRALSKLIEQGKIRFAGVSNFSVNEFREAQKYFGAHKIVSNQVEYSVFNRVIEKDVLPFNQKEQVTTLAYSPLDSGRIFSTEKMAQVQKVADKHGKTVFQILLRWLAHQETVVVLTKSTSLKHTEENAEALSFKFTNDDFVAIDEIFKRELVLIPLNAISLSSEHKKISYTSVEQALKNHLDLIPSPKIVAQNLMEKKAEIPVRVIRSQNSHDKYELIGNEIIYWAWVIAYGEEAMVPALVD